MIVASPKPSKQQQSIDKASSSCQQSSDQFQQQLDNPISDQRQRSFMQCCQKQQKNSNINPHHFCVEQPYSIELMFILFSFYHDDIINIGHSNQCKSKISLNKIKVISTISQEHAKECLKKICLYIDDIVFLQLNHQKKINIISSPYFNQKAKKLGITMCKFNNKIYCHANKITQKQLSTKIILFSSQNIFVVRIKSIKSKQRQIYNHYRYFIKKIIKQQYKQQFKKRQVVVQIDTLEININCIGTKQRDLVAAKNLLKNLLESTVILIVKYENQDKVDQKITQLKQYASQISPFPIIVAKVQQRSLTIISKQNIIRKFIQKSKVQQLINLKQKTQIGMFLPRRCNYNQRKIMIQQICLKKGYDFTTLGGIYHFFKKMFIHEGEQIQPKQIRQLINQILNSIKQNKQKFQIPSNHRTRLQKKIQQQFKGQYYTKGDKSLDLYLSQQLKRDVLKQTVVMGKNSLVRYRVSDTHQSDVVFWYQNINQQKILCHLQNMKLGTYYFSGKLKKNDKQTLFFIQYRYQLV